MLLLLPQQEKLTRMAVPKMVKNGINSPSGSRRADYCKENKRKCDAQNCLQTQKKNKNHFIPI